MNVLFLITAIVATCTSARAMVSYHGICDHLPKHVAPPCKGSVIKNGGFCGCFDVCAKLEGEECQAEMIRGRLPAGTCDKGLTCERQMDMVIGVGKCVKTSEAKPVASRSSQTQCQRERIKSMMVMIVYPGQWFPKCDAQGLFQPQQCDNQGMCFCVDTHTGEIDMSTKVKGSANCEVNTVNARDTQTLCQRRRIQSMIVQIVYPGQWFPMCDVDGLFKSEQCDNQGMCFCVDVNSGEIDLGSKVKGSANC